MTLIKMIIILLITSTFLFASPEAPKGFKWANSGPGESNFLIPKKWFLKIEKLDGTFALFITKEKIEDGKEFKTGFSLNAINRISKKAKVLPSKYAERFISYIVTKMNKEIIQKPWKRKNKMFTSYGMQYKDNVKTMHYLLIANDSTDTLFITWFESPPDEWDDAWKIGNTILNNLLLDSEI